MKEDKIDKNYLQIYTLYKLGAIEGNLKFEKVCFDLKDKLSKHDYKCSENFEFYRDDFGPRDKGLSRANVRFEMMKVIQIENELKIGSTIYKITEKGKLWIESKTKFFKKTIDDFDKIRDEMDMSIEENRNLSGSQIVKKESVQMAKKELLGKKL